MTLLVKLYKYSGGFPISLVPTAPTTVEQDSKIQWLRPLIFGILMSATYALIIYETYDIYGFVPDSIDNLAQGYGTSTFQVYLIYSISLYVGSAGAISFALFIWKRRDLSSLYGKVFQMEQGIGISGMTKSLVCGLGDARLLLMFMVCGVFSFIGSLLYSYVSYEACRSYSQDAPMTWMRWTYIVALDLDRIWTLCNPMVSSVHIICMDFAVALTDMIEQWKQSVENSMSVTDKDFKIKFEKHLLFGRYICNLADEANRVMAPFYLMSYGYFLLGGVMYCYGAFDIVFSIENVKGHTALLSFTFVIFAFVWFYGLGVISSLGDNLYCQRDAAIKALDDVIMDCKQDRLGESLTNSWSGVTRQLANVKISPYNYFELRNSTFLGMVTTIVTYLIIVLQFRAA